MEPEQYSKLAKEGNSMFTVISQNATARRAFYSIVLLGYIYVIGNLYVALTA